MRVPPASNPYNGFKSDTQRRKALATLVRWRTASAITMAMAAIATSDSPKLQAVLNFLLHTLR